MSANGPNAVVAQDGTLAAQLSDIVDAVATPTLSSPPDSDADITVTPAATTKCESVTQFDTTSNSDLCGNSELDSGDEKPARFVIEGVLVKSQKEQLKALRRTGGRAFVTCDIYTGVIDFDQLSITQESGSNTGTFTVGDRTLDGAVFTFQLQAKAEDA